MNNVISTAGLELAYLLVTSLLRQSWDAVQKQKIRTAADPNAQMALYDISETKHPNTTIISFLTPPVTLQDQQAMIPSTTLKDTNFPLFEFLCNKGTPNFSVNELAINFFAVNFNILNQLLTNLVDISSNSDSLILITGHSFGGCVATLFTLWLLQSLDLSKVKRPLCITFGSPLIGDGNLQQCVLQFSTWSSCFLNVASINDPVPKVFLTASQASDYKPFGTFLLCSASGCSCFEDPNAILQLLVETSSQSAQIQGPNSGIQFFDYGQILSDLKLKAFSRDVFELVEEDRFPLKAGIKTQLAAIFGVNSSQSLQQQQPDINFGNLIQKMETQERNHANQKKQVYSPFGKLNEIKKYMAYMEWYKGHSKTMGIGYYDSYKNKGNTYDNDAEGLKNKLSRYWQDTVEEVERKPQKEEAAMRTGFLFAGTNCRRMIEPLHIADHYKGGKKDYIKERPRHFVLLEQWFNEDEEKKKAEREKKERENPQLRSESKPNSKAKNVASSLNDDSCFWAHVEEALIWCNEQAINPDAKPMPEFELYVLNALQNFAVSPDIFLPQSSFMRWWNKYEEIVGSSYSSEFTDVMRLHTYRRIWSGVMIIMIGVAARLLDLRTEGKFWLSICNHDKKKPKFPMLIQSQALLVGLSSMMVSISTSHRTEKQELLAVHQIINWSIAGFSMVLPLFSANGLLSRLTSIFLGFAPTFLLLSIGYEAVFYGALALVLISWILVENTLIYSSKVKKLSSSFSDMEDNVILDGRHLQLSDVRIPLIFMVLFNVAFFGTGNFASIASFEISSVYRFITVFSPFLMAALLIFKLFIPFLLVICVFSAITKLNRLPRLACYFLVILFSDVMTMHFFFLVRNSGSWMEIGNSISHFGIMSAQVVFVLLLFALTNIYTKDIDIGSVDRSSRKAM